MLLMRETSVTAHHLFLLFTLVCTPKLVPICTLNELADGSRHPSLLIRYPRGSA